MSTERDVPAPAPGRIFTERDFWHGGELDLDAYLARVGLRGADLPPTLDTLRTVHRAHLAHIPFENLQLVLDRPVPLDVPALTDKMVRHRRGGYCYEQNLLLAAVLDRLGFVFTALAARVVVGAEGRTRPATHAVLLVELDGGRWTADVGFGGGGLLEPLPLVDGHQEAQGGWGLRLDRVDDVGADEWLLRSFDGRTWRDMYVFATAAVLPQDYAIHSHFLTSHPRSPFRNRLMAQRRAPGEQHVLTDTTLVTTRSDGTSEEREIGIGDVPDVLEEVFGIGLTARERGVVVERLKDYADM
ncbi:arylamine N-acetyltransferase [Nocardiopsis sp. NRRL B-16309]|uniref:arylamine N-acetyltransferase family protein n=1 Tax=Nocardiopsis sp. NRRL B-16309 TaxID=1519494 RepID=UPI0006B04F00|nr:arylamine N-acetyltransferase [Nocardiopsis sp. NRRL B-16309]KOX24147.1 N-hydroxyarylamine O-acetyltransferase [Nocardiopsis sp. NRRL B-16309]